MKSEHKKKLLNKRGYAFGIDLALIVITNYFMTYLFTLTLTQIFYGLPASSFNHMIDSVWSFSHYSILALAFAYFSLFNYLNEGKSFGKMILGLKIVNVSGAPMTVGQSMARALLNIASFKFFFLAFYVAFVRKDAKTHSDLLFKTEVLFDLEESLTPINKQPSTENLLLLNQLPDEGIYFEEVA